MIEEKKKDYEEWVDIAKGIAMLAIMYSHIRGGGININYIDTGRHHLYLYSFSSRDICVALE